jgi:integrase
MSNTHGPVMARQAKTILSCGLQLAVMANVLSTNPVRDVQPIKSKRPRKGAPSLTADQLRDLLARLRASDVCVERDLVDPFRILVATGLRRCELLGLRWSDFDETAGTLAVTGKVVRITGKGLILVDETKTTAGRRTIALPSFAVKAQRQRRSLPYLGEHPVIVFPSTAGTWRDPNNFGREWRTVRDKLGVPDVTTHSFRRSLATLIDDRVYQRGSGPITWPRQGIYDPRRVHGARQSTHPGRRPARRRNKRRINDAPESVRSRK